MKLLFLLVFDFFSLETLYVEFYISILTIHVHQNVMGYNLYTYNCFHGIDIHNSTIVIAFITFVIYFLYIVLNMYSD